MFSLKQKIALVTGSGSGIGASIAQIFAQAGAYVYILDRVADAGAKIREEIQEQGGDARVLEGDVSSPDFCNQIRDQILSEQGRLDILVNNAGIGHVGTILETEVSDLDRLYEVNVKGVFNMCKAFLPGMIEKGHGSVVNIASIGGLVAVKDRLAYCITKFGVVGLTKSMAIDHAKTGVRVNCICPGRVETPFVAARLKEYPDPDKAYQEMCSTQPMGRMGKPDEIAYAALYLASDESAFVTGSSMTVDGGWYAG